MLRNFSRLVIVLGAALLAGAPSLHAQSGQPVRGDVDGDGRVTPADARIVSDFLVGKPVPAGARVAERGDVNGDGRVTSVDAAIIARAAAGRDVSRFPVGRPLPESALAILECAADVRARSVSCGAPGASGDARGNVIVGGQNLNVKLTSSNLVINPADSTFTFNVTVQNLLRQAMAADSGTGAANANGVRVFFHAGPTMTEAAGSGSGSTVSVANFDGKATYTGTGPGGLGQPYFQYAGTDLGADGILSPNETSSPRTWTLKYDSGVNKFNFLLFLSTEVQYPQGWIDIYPPPPPARQDSSPTFIPTKTLQVGETAVLTGTVRNRFGSPLGTPVGNWSITSHGAATLGAPTSDSTVVVTAAEVGTDTVTATTGARTGRIEIVVVPGAPANMVKSAGDGQSATVGTAVATPPAVTITDSNGDPVPGVAVTFAVTGGGGSVTGENAVTNASGVATVGSWTLGTTAGANTLDASATGLTTVTFTATGTAGAAANMVKSAGDAQTATVGSAVATDPAVTITDAHGNPVAGVGVTFAVASGGGSVTDANATTDAAGVATVGSWTLGTTVGANTLDASSAGLTTVTFTATGEAGAVHHFVVEAAAGGNIPDQLAGTPFNVKVTAQDEHNNTATSFTGTVDFTSTPAGITAGAGPSAAFTAGVLGSHAITMSQGDYTGLTATRTGGTESGTSNAFQVQAAPTAVADGPTPTSAPGDPYHTAFNTTFNLATLGIMANDTRGLPLATVVSFGGGDLGGAVTDHPANGSAVSLPGHATGSLAVSADGSLVFIPPTGFTGLYTFQYRISNVRGTSDAQVTIAVGVRPVANNDSYPTNLLGNVPINTATSTNFNVTTNDAGDAKVLALGTSTNGTTTLAPGGTFIFTPNAGYTGPASFTYTVTNGFGTTALATVSMTVSGIAWFVDKGAAAGDGRFGTPFNDLSTAFAAATKPQANQPIFLYHDPASYTGGVTLLAGQRLVGEGATGASFAAVMGVTWPADAGTQPGIGGTNPTVNNGITLGSGNTLQGFNLAGTSGLTGTGFGTLTISQVGINTTGQALNLTTGTIAGSFPQVRSTGGTNNVFLSGVATSGTTTLGTAADVLSGATGDGIVINGGNGSFTYAGNITNTSVPAANVAVNVTNKTGGTVTFSGEINPAAAAKGISVTNNNTGANTILFSGANQKISSGTAAGVNLNNNAGATISFTGGALVVAAGTGNAFSATNSGTVSVTGAGNTLLSAGGIALNVSGTTIGGGPLTFRRIDATGGSNGIFLSGTGSNGLTVTGDGSSTHGSGGSIVNSAGTDGTTAGNGVYLSSAQNVSLNWMLFSGHANHAIYGLEVTGFTLNRTRITGLNGTNESFDDGAVVFDNLYGSASITSSYITGGRKDNVRVFNGLVASAAASLNRITLDNDTIFGNIAGSNVNIVGYKTAVVRATVQNSRFTSSRGGTINFITNENSSGDVVITGNNLSNSDPNQASGTTGIFVGNASSGALTYLVQSNTVNGMFGSGIEVDRVAGGAGSVGGSIRSNLVGTSGVAGSGSRDGAAIFVGIVSNNTGAATSTDTVANNVVRQFGNVGIKLVNRGPGGGYLSVQVLNNNIAEANTAVTLFPSNGIRFDIGAASGDDGKVCAVVTGNTTVNTGTNGESELRVRGRFATKTGIPGGAANPNAFYAASNSFTGPTPVNATSINAFQNVCPPV